MFVEIINTTFAYQKLNFSILIIVYTIVVYKYIRAGTHLITSKYENDYSQS